MDASSTAAGSGSGSGSATTIATGTGTGTRHRIRVAVVFGGRSSEHAISCVTAAGVLRVLNRDRYDVVPIGITPAGRWVLAPDEPTRWDLPAAPGGPLPEVTGDEGPGVLVPLEVGRGELVTYAPGELPRALAEVDVVLPLLHGPFGEDGTLQGLLELGDVRYVGSGVLASAASMDKHVMKVMLAGAGLSVGRHVLVTPKDWERDPTGVAERVAELGWPVFVKPARAGSSIGITRVTGPGGPLTDAIELARSHDPKVVVEAAIVGREIECAVLEDIAGGPPLTSVCGEIEVVAGHDFYDFEAKYLDAESVRLTTPADLPEDVAGRVRELAARTFEVMGCEGLARVDFFVGDDGEVTVNELNTMPGFTPFSMYPRLWQASGVPYAELVDRLLRLALRRRTGLR